MKTYTILEISKNLSTNKEKVRQTINKLGILAENEHTRLHNNEAKIYGEQEAKFIIEKISEMNKNLNISENESNLRNNAQDAPDNAQDAPDNAQNAPDNAQNAPDNAQDQLLEILKEQLKEKDKLLDRSYEEKKELMRTLNEAQQLLNQQQQLSLQSTKKINLLENVIEETKKSHKKEIDKENDSNDEKKLKWYDVFKKKK